MGEILNPHKLEVFDPEEDYDINKQNENIRKINAALPTGSITRAASTVNGNDFDFTPSVFTKMKEGTLTFVIAEFKAIMKAGGSLAVPSNINSAASIAGVIPAGYQPRATVNMQGGPVFSGEGRGDNMQGGISGQNLLLRSTGAAFTRASSGNVLLAWNVSYQAVD